VTALPSGIENLEVKLGDVKDKEMKQTEEKKAEEAKAEEVKKEEVKKTEGPPADSPRFNQIYGKMKHLERQAEEREKDMDAVRAHNQKLAAAIEEIKTAKADKTEDPAPDPAENPEAYKAWNDFRYKKMEQKQSEDQKVQQVSNLIEIETGLHEDYESVVAIAERDMARDEGLKKRIWGTSNPARAAYKYAKGKMKELDDKVNEGEKKVTEEANRQKRLDQVGGESADLPPAPGVGKDELSDDEKRVVRNMYTDIPIKEAEKRYLVQKKQIAAANAGRK